jgi:hypothetical protein
MAARGMVHASCCVTTACHFGRASEILSVLQRAHKALPQSSPGRPFESSPFHAWRRPLRMRVADAAALCATRSVCKCKPSL